MIIAVWVTQFAAMIAALPFRSTTSRCSLGLADKDLEKIYEGNAKRLLKI